MPQPSTISAALQSHRLQPSGYATYEPFRQMTARFLGEEPSFYPILAISQPAIRTHVGLFARMFHCPAVDMCFPGLPSADVRRIAFLSASRAFGCTYCEAHSAAFGDILRGSVPSQIRRGRVVNDNDLNESEELVAAFATAAVCRPCVEDPANKARLRQLGFKVQAELNSSGLEVVNAVIAFAGALNTIMDVQGVELESSVQAFASEHIGNGDEPWSPGKYHGFRGGEVVAEGTGGTGSGMLSNIMGLFATMPAAMKGMALETFTLYNGIPSSGPKLVSWMDERIGAEHSEWFRSIRGTELRRAFCFGLRENVLVPDAAASPSGFPCEREWTLKQRLQFLHVFGVTTQSKHLCSAAVELLVRSSAEIDASQAAAELTTFDNSIDENLESEAVAAGRRLVVAEATRLDNISPDLIEKITSTCSPVAVLELASLLSFFKMWRRMVLLFSLKYSE